MKLLEITSKLSILISEYLKSMTPELSKAEFGEPSFKVLCEEPGNCAMISEHLAGWLRDQHVSAKTFSGYFAKDPKWCKTAKVQAGSDEDAHTVVRVGNEVVDLTARQFDLKLPFPRIIPLSQFKSEWKETD